jgi:hypothetical protein
MDYQVTDASAFAAGHLSMLAGSNSAPSSGGGPDDLDMGAHFFLSRPSNRLILMRLQKIFQIF